MNQFFRDRNELTCALGTGAEATEAHGATQADIILLTHLTLKFSSVYTDENLMTGPSPSPTLTTKTF